MLKPLIVFTIFWIFGVSSFAFANFENLVTILENTVSPDGHIEYPKTVILQIILAPITHVLPIYLSGCVIFKREKHSPKLYLFWSFLVMLHLFAYLNFSQFFQVPTEDNFGEFLTVSLSLIAGILFLISGYNGMTLAYIMAMGWLFFAFEEISWGQRILEFDTPDLFLTLNKEQELTLHNTYIAFNGIYILVNMTIMMFLKYLRNVEILKKFYLSPRVYPLLFISDKYCLWFVPLILTICLILSGRSEVLQEFVEQQWAVFGFVYSSLLLINYNKLRLKN